MCYFPLPNFNVTSPSYKKGIVSFDCGACPECLRKRANVWALRSVYEAKLHAYNCMVTLTYDSYIHDCNGNVVGERVSDFSVCKRDVQLFIKRLRKWYFKEYGLTLKYFCGAEYGKRTHRAHYHLILFNVRFPDLVPYKRSKRGNQIYKSAILTNLWNNGICTVDSININSAVAKYCTKYCAKERSDDTFMLASQKIGFNALLSDFNGISYFVEGREYPIPRFIWQYYISEKYKNSCVDFTYKYLNKTSDNLSDGSFQRNVECRFRYRVLRDSDPLYENYLNYWNAKSKQFESFLLPIRDRILLLDDSKYHFYKISALNCLALRKIGIPAVAPRSNCRSFYNRWFHGKFPNSFIDEFGFTCPISSRPYRASDTVDYQKLKFCENRFVFGEKRGKIFNIIENSIDNPFSS